MTREHFWPKWLIAKTDTQNTGVRWMTDERISTYSTTLPLCERCNNDFGINLEAPTSQIFDKLEAGQGISDHEAEVLIRWMWKFEGLSWCLDHPQDTYSTRYTLFDRVIRPIDEIRGNLLLALSLIAEIEPDYGDAPMGIDSKNKRSAVFVSGVFSRIAIIAALRCFESEIPGQFSCYHLANKKDTSSMASFFYPKTGFATCTEAVGVTKTISPKLSLLHDRLAKNFEDRTQRSKAST